MKTTILKECLRIARRKNKLHAMQFKHYAFIVQNNKLIEWARNRKGSIPKTLGYPKYANVHAECSCYYKAKGILDRQDQFELVSIRLNKQGLLRSGKPCKSCMTFLELVGCAAVYFTTDFGFQCTNTR